jgi:hypothetical protein
MAEYILHFPWHVDIGIGLIFGTASTRSCFKIVDYVQGQGVDSVYKRSVHVST